MKDNPVSQAYCLFWWFWLSLIYSAL